MAQIVVRISDELAGWLEAEYPKRGEISQLVRGLLYSLRANEDKPDIVDEIMTAEGGTVARLRRCAHPKITFKFGQRFCEKCGEFV